MKKVKTQKTWEHIMFTIGSEDEADYASIELVINHEDNTYTLSSETQENLIEFPNDSINAGKNLVKCIQAAIKYASEFVTESEIEVDEQPEEPVKGKWEQTQPFPKILPPF